MKVCKLTKENPAWLAQAASLLSSAFPHCYGETAEEEINNCLDDERIAFVAVENDCVVGFVGAIPQYGTTGWELHPLVVRADRRGQGIGAALVHALEAEVAARGGITIYLGSDDEFGETSLYGADLYTDMQGKIANIQNKNRHPYEFYQKLGYKIVGVIPDANGIGKPDIWMAKRINFQVRPIKESEIEEALSLVWRVFSEFEAPDYCEEGIQEFQSFIEYNTIKQKIEAKELNLWCCFDRDTIAGVITTRPPCHISLLFVDKQYHKRGIARALLNTALEFYKANSEMREMTVNSSPYATEAYHRLGFVDTDIEQTVNGVRFIPMKLNF